MHRASNILRRAAATLAMVGVATFGAAALAPAASASTALGTSSSVVPATGVGGPVSFLVTDQGRMAVFFCDPSKPMQRHDVCQPDPALERF